MRNLIIAVACACLVACQSSKSSTPIVKDDAARPAQGQADENEVFLNGFVDDLAANRLESAYAKMAPTYREANPLAKFKGDVEASPYLKGARRVKVRRTFDDTAVTEAFLSTRGGSYLMSAFVEKQGAERRLLVFAIAGVPVLQGVKRED